MGERVAGWDPTIFFGGCYYGGGDALWLPLQVISMAK